MSQITIQRQKLEWYIKLLQDLQKLIVKRERADLEIKHDIGKRILEDKRNITEPISKFVERLATDLTYSSREIWYCIKFAETYPTMNDLITDYAKSKGVSPETISIDDLPAWRDLRNFILSKGFESLDEEKGQKPPEEPKQCEMEKVLSDLLTSLVPLRAETLQCKDCDIKERCFQVKTKIMTSGERLIQGN